MLKFAFGLTNRASENFSDLDDYGTFTVQHLTSDRGKNAAVSFKDRPCKLNDFGLGTDQKAGMFFKPRDDAAKIKHILPSMRCFDEPVVF